MSDTEYRQLVEAVVEYALYALSPKGEIVSWNPGAQQIKGYTSAEVVGLNYEIFFTDEDLESDLPRRNLEQARRTGRYAGQGWRVRKNGERFWASVALDAIRDPSGELIGFAKITRDMSVEHDALEALRRSEQTFRLLVQGVTDYAIYMLDPGGIVTNWNAGAERTKGYKAGEIVGKHFSSFYTPEDRAAGIPELALKTALETGRFEAEGWRVRKDGRRFWASVVLDPIRDDEGVHIGFAKITRDLTERREAQLRLEETREQLFQSQKMEALGQLTGGMAHDFNNLLTVVLGAAEMARRQSGDNDRLKRLLDSIQASAQRGAGLTRQLLAFARRQPLRPEVIDLSDQLGSIANLLRHSLGGDFELVCEWPKDLGRVEVDPSQLDLALLNLGLNARDAMEGRGMIKLTAEPVELTGDIEGLYGEFYAIRVTDTGKGIAPEILGRIFEPFFTTKDAGAGTGLGLSQAYGFARQSEGAVKVQSKLGWGTTVSLYLPTTSLELSAPVAERRIMAPSRPARILIVEDEPSVAELAADLVREMGHEPVLAHSAEDGLKVLSQGDYDLVFSDIMMPGAMNGLDLAREVRTRYPNTPVLLTTGYSEAAALKPPEFPLITKPYQYRDLCDVIGPLLAAA